MHACLQLPNIIIPVTFAAVGVLHTVSCSFPLQCDRFHLSSDVNLKDVVCLLPAKLTGADLYSVCSNAWLIALRTLINNLTHGKYLIPSSLETQYKFNYQPGLFNTV